MNEKQRKAILEYLNDCKDEEILSIVRDINSYNGKCEHLEWFDMEYEFDELCGGMKPFYQTIFRIFLMKTKRMTKKVRTRIDAFYVGSV